MPLSRSVALPSPPVDLAAWRARLLQLLLHVVCWLGWVVGVPSLTLAALEGVWPLVTADVVAMGWVTVLLRQRSWGHRSRTLQLLGLMYGLGVVLLWKVGFVAQVYLMALPVLAVLLLSQRVAVVCLALNGLTLALGGSILQADTGMRLMGELPQWRWLVITLNFLLINTVVTWACIYVLRGMEAALREHQANARLLAHQVLHDALTGLANRRLLTDRMERALAQAGRDGTQVAVLLLDLDGFKNINDSHGHGEGDALIVAVAQRLLEAVRAADTVARFGGDEFVVVLPELRADSELLAAVERVMAAVTGRYPLLRHETHVSASIGVAVFPRDGDDPATLIKNADTAMYRAKEAGRSRFQFFQSAMNERLLARLELEEALRNALERGELLLYYQPRVCAQSQRCHGAEALVRWQHPQWGLVSPARFIPVAEETGLIVPMGAWILRTAAEQLARWQCEFAGLSVSVNVSAREFRSESLPEQVGLAAALVRPGSLELEVTESLVMHHLQTAQQQLTRIRDLGVRVALDDFGTGFSSLAYLKTFPLDVLKIDQSFVRGLETDPQDQAIAQTIVDLASNLQMRTVAEGVETAQQARLLADYGVQELQGYWFAKPMPAAEFETWLRANHASAPPPSDSPHPAASAATAWPAAENL